MTRRILGIPDALHLRPLVEGLGGADSPITIHRDVPAQLSVQLSQRIPPLEAGCAFLTPLDYARHGGPYRIIPGIGASSRTATRTIRLLIRQQTRSIGRVAVDVRVSSEIVLLKILLTERFPDLSGAGTGPEFVAMTGTVIEQLERADAVLVVNLEPIVPRPSDTFALDLVEEWVDMTDLPYPHGFWVGHEDSIDQKLAEVLSEARTRGVAERNRLAAESAKLTGTSEGEALSYLSAFSYDLTEETQDAVSEFFRYAYYHGVLGDIPDLKFAE